MTRKLALVVATCLGLFHEAAWALGLGDIDVESALNQPFSATIELRNTDTLERNEIIANLASVEDFERVGVERFFFLSDLSFETDLSDPRAPVLRVSSSQPITEPFVNFVVEVLWPSGRLLKEFTILLDPPTYAARPISAPQAPASTGSIRTTPAPAATTPDAGAGSAAASTSGSTTGTGTLTGDRYGVTDRNDTLWDIALKVRPDRSLSVHQTMLALLRLNPEAFIGNNINQLKAGYVLRVPSADEVRRLSLDDAIVQVAEQNDRWRSGLDRAPLDARDRGAGAQRGASSGGELRLVSGTEDAAARDGLRTGEGDARTPAAAGGDDGALQAELAAARSELEAERRANATLREEVASSSSERAELQRQIELKNEQLARLQAAVQEQMQTPGSSPPRPAAANAPAAAGGLFGFSWLVIGAAVGGLLLLGAVVLLLLRRLSGSTDEEPVAPFTVPEPEPAFVAEQGVDESESAAGLAPEVPGEEPGEGGAAEEDVLAEADVYMAYGNFSEAAAALGAALEADPNRADIRLKLLEVHVEQGDVDAFNEQAFVLQGMADEATVAEADRLAARLPGAATSTGDIISGDAASAPREAREGGVSLDFDLAMDDAGSDAPGDLDSLDIDLDLDDDGGAGADDGDFGLDFEDDEDKKVAGPGATVALDAAGAAQAGGDGAEDEFELAVGGGELSDDDSLPDLDFDLEDDEPAARVEIGAGAATEASEDLNLDIDALDQGDEGSAPTVAAETDSDFANRTIVSGGEELESALGLDGGGDDLDFDIDDLAEPTGPAAPDAGAPSELAMADVAGGEPRAASEAQGDAGLDAELDFELDEDFDFGNEGEADEISTKLELARAYVDMGDEEGAKEILDEVVRDGDDGQKKEAGELLAQIG
ncbi:MAG: FimV/HubP family polar landmark protein [Pseudomonadales bacterium]|jgi:pilus assembly protein FimV|nr:FimV/HubP family polar landmark protein [Pseudomonadales bacterium]